MSEIERIQNTPIIRLTLNELRMLPPDDLSNAIAKLWDMTKDGSLEMVRHNPPGTTYDVQYDKELGWKLTPICLCKKDKAPALAELTPGAVAVMQDGARVAVLPHEGSDDRCFTGHILGQGDLSTLWDRSKIDRVEQPDQSAPTPLSQN